MGRHTLASAPLLAALLMSPAGAQANEITSPEDGAEVMSPLVVSVEFSCDFTECNEYECYPTAPETLTLNVDGEALEVRELEPCGLLSTEEFELELSVGTHTVSSDIVYPSLAWTSPEITIEVLETPVAATAGEDTDGDDATGCGCTTTGPSAPIGLVSLLALPLVRRRRPGDAEA